MDSATSDTSAPLDADTVLTIAQRARGAPWRLGLSHARDTHLLIWVTRGAARCIVEGRGATLGAHNAVFVPARTLFSFSFEATCFGQTVALPRDAAQHWPERPMLLRVREPKAQLMLTHYIEAIQTEVSDAAPLAAQAIAAHAQLMSVWAQRYAEVRPPASASTRLMQAFCALVERSEHVEGGGRTMADFAAKLGVTPTHLTRVCKAQCGLTAADLLTEHALQRARRMLEDQRMKAVDVSGRLGFSTPAYFTRFIKTHTGKTPGQLRQSAQKVPGRAAA